MNRDTFNPTGEPSQVVNHLDSLSTFQLARAAQWEIKNLKRKICKVSGHQVYHVDLNGVTMPATEARKLLVAHIEAKQAGKI